MELTVLTATKVTASQGACDARPPPLPNGGEWSSAAR